MEFSFRQQGRICIFAPHGRIDQAHAEAFQQALAPHLADCSPQGSPLLLDFSGVDYISSVGLRVLILATKQAKAQNGKIAIAALTPVVAEVFQISRLNLVFQVFADVDAAVAEWSR